MQAKTKLTLNGHVDLYSFPKDFTYEDYQRLTIRQRDQYFEDAGDNKIVDVGLNFILDFLIQEGPAAPPTGPTHCSVGSGTNAPAAGDTGLQTEILTGGVRIAITTFFKSSLTANLDTFFTSADGNGPWEETGLHNAATGSSTIYCRKRFSSTFTKDTSKTALVAWSITVASLT